MSGWTLPFAPCRSAAHHEWDQPSSDRIQCRNCGASAWVATDYDTQKQTVMMMEPTPLFARATPPRAQDREDGNGG